MNAVYTYFITLFLNKKCDIPRITREIHDSSITIALDYINISDSIVSFFFKAQLSGDEEIKLGEIVAAHTGESLDDNTIQQVRIAVEQPKYIEAGNTTQELFCAESLIIDVSSGDNMKTAVFSWPFHIALKSGTIYVTDNMIGDEMVVKITPDIMIGALTSAVSVGDTSAKVSPTVVQNIKYGQFLGLPLSQLELGRVVTIGTDHVTFDNPIDVSANAGSLLGVCAKIIPYLYFSKEGVVEIGKTLTTANRIPKDTMIILEYKNNNGLAKKISFFVEYLY